MIKPIAISLMLILAAAPASANPAGESIHIIHGTPQDEAAAAALMDESEVAAELWTGRDGACIKKLTGRFRLDGKAAPREAVLRFMAAHSAVFGLTDPEAELKEAGSYAYEGGLTLGFSQVYMGLAVWDKGLSATIDAEGKLVEIGGDYVPTPELDTKELITPDDAVERAKEDLGVAHGYRLSIPPETEKVIYEGRLAYHVVMEFFNMRWEYFVDAKNGQVMHRRNTSMLSMGLVVGRFGDGMLD